MDIDLNKEAEDVVNVIDVGGRNWLLIGFVSMATVLVFFAGAILIGAVSIQIPNRPATLETQTTDNKIKGNKKSRIYHWRGCPNYDDIADYNVVFFKTREDAEQAGYRPARNC